jgi:pimeloyl-ACP methyl ester carboxylesterase
MIAIWWLGTNHPRLVHAYLQLAVSDRRLTVEAAEKRLRRLSHWCSKSDQVLLAGSKVKSVLARSMAEGLRQGGASSRDEAERLVAPWRFEPSDVTFAQMSLWHGGEDRLMPIAPARLLAEALPHCEAVYYPSEGHFSVLASKATEILSSLAIG